MPQILRAQQSRGLPFVAYRLPSEDVVIVHMQNSTELHFNTDFSASGFVFAPFDPSRPPLLLKTDTTHKFQSGPSAQAGNAGHIPDLPRSGKRGFVSLVEKAKEYIASGACRKVVLSHKLEVVVKADPVGTFQKILNHYPGAFCYLWYHPDTGNWLGASPELLLEAGEGRLKTMSLAGTVKDSGAGAPAWGGKEMEEQGLVTEYIREILGKQLRKVKVSPPRTIKAGNLYHLQSGLVGELSSNSLPAVIKSLHPTPAVCGLPLNNALSFIRSREGYDREYYTGFLGELVMASGQQEARLFVNLRCMSMGRRSVQLYVGAGITTGSSPEAEWEETLHKAETMLRVLGN